jgi:hypothetical protein
VTDDYAMRLVTQRCPEVAEAVVPVSVVALMLEVVSDLERRLRALQDLAGGQEDAGGYEGRAS